MLSGYEFELANKIHQERLQRAKQSRMLATFSTSSSGGIERWLGNVLNALKRAWPYHKKGRPATVQ